jgi:protein SCO1
MNRRAMFAARPLSAALALALLAACDPGDGGATADAPLAGADIGGPFELVNSKGETVRWSDFDGKYRIVYFGFTYCPDVCPTDVARMSQGLAQFEEAQPALAAQVQPIFISVDPERDTPAIVGEFAGNFHPRLIGLTGSPEQVRQTTDTFKVAAQKGEVDAGGNYLVNHSTITYLFGPDGQPIATLPTDQGPEAVAAELDRWVS